MLLSSLMLPLATTELGVDSWVTDLMTPEFKELGWRALYETTAEPAVREFQFVGEAGSALFWHGAFTGMVSSFAKRKKVGVVRWRALRAGMLPHTASVPNVNPWPRLAILARWCPPELSASRLSAALPEPAVDLAPRRSGAAG